MKRKSSNRHFIADPPTKWWICGGGSNTVVPQTNFPEINLHTR